MVKTLTIDTEILAGRKLEIQLPDDVPTGPAKVSVVVTTDADIQTTGEAHAWARYCLEHPLDTDRTDLSENVEDFTGRRF